jgi:hypothetical protein
MPLGSMADWLLLVITFSSAACAIQQLIKLSKADEPQQPAQSIAAFCAYASCEQEYEHMTVAKIKRTSITLNPASNIPGLFRSASTFVALCPETQVYAI